MNGILSVTEAESLQSQQHWMIFLAVCANITKDVTGQVKQAGLATEQRFQTSTW